MTRRFTICLLFILYIPFGWAQNLITNGDAELPLLLGELIGWTEVSGNSWGISANGGYYTTQSGQYHFFAGSNATSAELIQDIDVSTYATFIDNSTQAFTFTGYTRSFQDVANDLSRIVVEYYNGAMGLLATYDTGDQSQAGANNNDPNGWLLHTDQRIAPVGTRTIRIRLISTRLHGSDNDGYYDNLSLEPSCVGGTTDISINNVCEGDMSNLSVSLYGGTDIQWQKSANGGSWTDFGTGQTTEIISENYADNPVEYRAIVSTSTCADTSATSTLTIAPAAIAGTISAGSSSLCDGESTTLDLLSSTGTRQWQQSLAGGAFTNFGSGLLTESISPTAVQDPAIYRVIVTNGSCVDTTAEDTIRIFSLPVSGSINQSQTTICEGDDASLTLVGYTGLIRWQQSLANSAWTDFGGTSDIESVSPTVGESIARYRVITFGGTCADTSDEISITVTPAAVGGTITTGTQSLCEGQGNTTVSVSGEVGSLQWEQQPNGASSWTNLGTGQTTENVLPTVTESPMLYRLIATNGTCTDISDTATITTFPQAQGGNITASAIDICEGNSVLLDLSNSSGLIEWEVLNNGGTWTTFGGTSTQETVSPTLVNSPVQYRAILTAGSCQDTSDTSSITVFPNAVGGTVSILENDICDGSSGTIALNANSGTVQWQFSKDNGSWTNFGSGLSTENISLTLADDTTRFRAISTLGICQDTSDINFIHIQPLGTPGTLNLLTTTICEGDTAYPYLTNQVGNITWQQNYNNTGWVNSLSTLPVEEVTGTSTQSPIEIRALVALNGCEDTTNSELLTVVSPPIAGTISGEDTLCFGTTTSLSLTGSTGGTTYEWFSSDDGISYTSISTGSTTYTTDINAAALTDYFVSISNGTCVVESDTFTIVTLPSLAGTLTISSNDICLGDDVDLTLTGSSGQISWEKNEDNSSWVSFGGTISTQTDTPDSMVAQYRAIASLANCTETSNVVDVNVSTVPAALNSLIGTLNTCEASSYVYSVSPSTNATGYTWTVSGNATQSNTLSVTSIEITTGNAGNSTVEVYPTNSCGTGLTPDILNITVLEQPDITLDQTNATICAGDDYVITTTEDNGLSSTNLSYNWLYNENETFINTDNLTTNLAGTYAVITTYQNQCSDTSSNFILSVEEVEVEAGEDFTLTKGDSISPFATSNGSWAYQWTSSEDDSTYSELTPYITPEASALYTIVATGPNGCIATDSFYVNLVGSLLIPNCFTPNDDYSNDTWEIDDLTSYENYTVTVYNRWGGPVYENVSSYSPWDGTHNGKKLPVGTYYYVINIIDTQEAFSGTVTILK